MTHTNGRELLFTIQYKINSQWHSYKGEVVCGAQKNPKAIGFILTREQIISININNFQYYIVQTNEITFLNLKLIFFKFVSAGLT